MGSCMDGIMLKHLEWFMIIMNHYMSAIAIHVKFLETVADEEAFSFDLSISVFSISQRLTCKGKGQTSCMSTALSPYSLAFVLIMAGFFPFKYTSVVLRSHEEIHNLGVVRRQLSTYSNPSC